MTESFQQNKRVSGIPDVVLKTMTDQKSDSKYPTDIIPLPTKGHFYADGHPLSCGEIELKQMSAKEEDILANQNLIKSGKVLDKLLDSLIVNKAIKHEEILIPDKNAIFIAIRRLAYGDEYPIAVTCPNCSTQNRVTINLGTVETKPFNFESYPRGENSFEFKLPHSGVTVTYKLLNQIDEQSIDAELTQFKKLYKDKEASKELTTRLKYLLTSVDGNADRAVIRKFVDEQLMAKDSFALRKQMREHNPDVDMSFDFKCENCSLERRLDIPIGINFLWADIEP